MELLNNIEFAVLDFIYNNLSCKFLDYFFSFFTQLGDAGLIWFIIGFILLCTKKYRVGGIYMLITLGIGFLFGYVIMKPLIARPRPCWINQTINLIIENPDDYSFPSGHTISSWLCATSLIYINRKFAYWAIPLATLIAFSRLYLYVHFPTDILFGIVYGILVATLCRYLARKFVPQFKY